MSHAFLEGFEHRLLVARLDIDHASCRKSDLSYRRGEQVLACHAPQDLSLGPGDDAGSKQSSSCAIDGAVPAPCNLMQRAHGQTSTGEVPIDDVDAKWQYRPLGSRASFEALYAFAELRDYGIFGGMGHFGS